MRAVVAGVLAGLLVSATLVAAVLLSLPDEPLGRVPFASPSVATTAPDGVTGSPGPDEPSAAPATPAGGVASPGSSAAVGLRVGDAAPPLAVPQLGGGMIDLTAVPEGPVWVNFTASWCPPCRDELPLMERIQDQLGERLTILVIDVREDPDTVASLATELGLTLPIGLDRDGRAQLAWGAYALPVHYWLDADRRIRHVLYGGPGPDRFLEAVRSVVPDAEIEL